MAKNSWNNETETPSELNPAGNGFSVDVLIFCERTGEHTVGWFDYQKHVWNFLCREPVKDFQWRNFTDDDKPKTQR